MKKKILYSVIVVLLISIFCMLYPALEDLLYFKMHYANLWQKDQQAYEWLIAQQRTNRQLVFFKNGLLPSSEYGNDCFTYDQALAAICFSRNKDFKKAEKIFDFFDNVRKEQIKKYGKFIGFSDAYKANGCWGETWAAGPNAWMLMALNTYMYYTNDVKYLSLSEDIAQWLIGLESIEGGIVGGYYGNHEPMTWIATEHNLDCYAAFRDLGLITNNKEYLKVAKNIKYWMEHDAWSDKQQRFYMGRQRFNRNYATDLSSWAVLSLGDKYITTLDFAIEHSLCKHYYEPNNIEVEGFDFGSTYNESPYPDKDAVWFEGTGQMVLAFLKAGNGSKGTYFLHELDKALTVSKRSSYVSGLPYASNEGTPAYGSWLMQDEPLCISSTAWYYLAKYNHNPFSYNQKLDEANRVINELDYEPNYQFTPIIDDFQYSRIKFETAYPLESIIRNNAQLKRVLLSEYKKFQDNCMELTFNPEQGVRGVSASVVRPFMMPQDWSSYKNLCLKVFSDNTKIRVRIHIKDSEAEPFESIKIKPEAGKWKEVVLNFEDSFKRSKAASGYGNSQLERDQIREFSIEVFTLKGDKEVKILIDNIVLR